MAHFRAWLSNMVSAVQSRNVQALQDRLDWNDSVANACASRQPVSAMQLERQTAEGFRSLNSDISPKWAAFAFAHMGAFVSDKNGQLMVCSSATLAHLRRRVQTMPEINPDALDMLSDPAGEERLDDACLPPAGCQLLCLSGLCPMLTEQHISACWAGQSLFVYHCDNGGAIPAQSAVNSYNWRQMVEFQSIP